MSILGVGQCGSRKVGQEFKFLQYAASILCSRMWSVNFPNSEGSQRDCLCVRTFEPSHFCIMQASRRSTAVSVRPIGRGGYHDTGTSVIAYTTAIRPHSLVQSLRQTLRPECCIRKITLPISILIGISISSHYSRGAQHVPTTFLR